MISFSNLKNSKTLISIFWVGIEKFGYSGLNFISTIILARLLTPDDFGIMAIVAIFISFSQMIVESGLGGALVKKEIVTKNDYDTIFTFNISCSIILYFILFVASPYIADFYNKDILKIITRVVGFNIILSALTLTQRIHLIRDLNFKKQSLISIIALLFSILISIAIGYLGYGVWALVSQQLTYNILYFIIIFKLVRYKPNIGFNKSSFNELFGFGSKIFGSSLISILYNEGITSIVGKIYSLATTGLYYQGKKLVDFPINIFKAFGDNLVFPILSRITDNVYFSEKASQLMRMILFISLPLFVMLYFFSNEIVYLVLGKQWIKSGEILSILSISSSALLIDTVSRNILKATGNGTIILKSEVYKRILGFILILFFIKYDLNIFLYAIVIGNIIGCIINIIYVNNNTAYKFKNQILDTVPIILICFVSGFFAKNVSYYLTDNNTLNVFFSFIFMILFIIPFSLLYFYKSFKGLLNKSN